MARRILLHCRKMPRNESVLPRPAGERKGKETGLPQPAGEEKWKESGLPQLKRPEGGRSGSVLPEKYPVHKEAIPNAPHENAEYGKSGLKDTLPPSIQPGTEEEKIPQARNDERVSISVNAGSYRRFRNGRGGTGMNFGSPVNIICLLITLVGLAFVALYWELVTTTLMRGILIAAANLAAVLLLIAGIFVLVFLIRRFMGRGGLLRRMFR